MLIFLSINLFTPFILSLLGSLIDEREREINATVCHNTPGPRYTKDGRVRAPIHLIGPHRNRRKIAAGPGIFFGGLALLFLKYKYESWVSETPQSMFLNRIKIVPYGVLGTQLSLQGGLVTTGSLPDSDTTICDPAGLNYIHTTSEGAGGASGAIYNFIGLKGPFPDPVRLSIQRVGDAKYNEYRTKVVEALSNKEPHEQNIKVIHTVGPDFREGKWSEREATIELTRAYRNVLHEFVGSQGTKLRLLPISSGVFAGPLYDQMPKLTQDSIAAAFDQLHPFDKEYLSREYNPKLKGTNQSGVEQIELCIFLNREWDMYKKCFYYCTPPNTL